MGGERTGSQRMRAREALAVFLVLAVVWGYGLVRAALPHASRSATIEYLSELPDLREDNVDATLYRHIVARVHDGEGYYAAAAEVLRLNNEYDDADIDLGSPLSYRLPTMYVVLGLLPVSGLAYVLATLTVGSVAAIGGFLLARRFARLPVALVSCGLVGMLYAGFADGVAQFGAEVWAGALGMLSLGLLVRAKSSRGMWAAALAALAAASVRELAVAFVLLGLASTLADRGARRERQWLPWLAALALAVAVYAAHFAALAPHLGPDKYETFRFVWFDPTGAGLVSMVVRDTWFLSMYAAVGWALLVLGVIGGLVAPRRALERVALGLAVIGGPLVLGLFHPPGTGYLGTVPGYWSDLVAPALLACAPLAALVAPRLREEQAEGVAEAEQAEAQQAQ